MKNLIISEHFPAWHRRRGEPTRFIEQIVEKQKIHTIRSNSKGYFKDGDLVKICCWSGQPYRSKQIIKFAAELHLEPITLFRGSEDLTASVGFLPVSAKILATNDGLSAEDFSNWFFPDGKTGGLFKGWILHFTTFRYLGRL